jgi:hypothetical protein
MVQKAVHALDGSLRFFTSGRAHHLAESLEAAAVRGELEQASATFSSLAAEIEVVIGQLRGHVGEPQSAS